MQVFGLPVRLSKTAGGLASSRGRPQISKPRSATRWRDGGGPRRRPQRRASGAGSRRSPFDALSLGEGRRAEKPRAATAPGDTSSTKPTTSRQASNSTPSSTAISTSTTIIDPTEPLPEEPQPSISVAKSARTPTPPRYVLSPDIALTISLGFHSLPLGERQFREGGNVLCCGGRTAKAMRKIRCRICSKTT